MLVAELRVIDRRIALINRAMLLLVVAAILTGIIVALLFVGSLTDRSLVTAISAAFISAMGLFLVALLAFLRETRIATAALKIPANYLELDRRI
jgi:drug/metabolite transporter (DMT)-like permease